jgi:uncharacterized protein
MFLPVFSEGASVRSNAARASFVVFRREIHLRAALCQRQLGSTSKHDWSHRWNRGRQKFLAFHKIHSVLNKDINGNANMAAKTGNGHKSGTRQRLATGLARATIKGYRLTLSPILGTQCRHLPTCSDYADDALARHGVWAGGWMTLARLLRCHPFGTRGLDFVPGHLPAGAAWYLPWRYGRWFSTNPTPDEGVPMNDHLRGTVNDHRVRR